MSKPNIRFERRRECSSRIEKLFFVHSADGRRRVMDIFVRFVDAWTNRSLGLAGWRGLAGWLARLDIGRCVFAGSKEETR